MHLILFLVALACQRSAANPTKDEEKYDRGGQQLKYGHKDAHRSKRSSENFAALGLGAVYPVQVDLTDWIVRSEKRMENLTALVESHFRGIATLIEGFQKKFEDLEERIHSLKERTQRNFNETNNRFQSMENSLEKLKENCSRPWVDYATAKATDFTIVTDQSRASFAPTSPSTFPNSITPSLPPKKKIVSSTEWSCDVDPCAVTSPWILIMERDTAESYSFENANWKQYRGGFGKVHSSAYWRGLQELHELTSKGRWTLKIQFKYPYSWETKDQNGQMITRSRIYGEAEWGNFSVGPAAEDYPLGLGKQTSATNFEGDPFILKDGDGKIWNQRGAVFSSPDYDNADCAKSRGGGWWFPRGECSTDICLTCEQGPSWSNTLIARSPYNGQRFDTGIVESFMWIKKEE